MTAFHETHKPVSLRCVGSGNCIHTVTGAANGVAVHMWEGCGSPNENWTIRTVKKIDDKRFIVQIMNGDFYMTLASHGREGTPFVMSSDASSQWELEYIGHDTVVIKSVACDLYINVDSHTAGKNGGRVHLWGNRSDSLSWDINKWKLVPVESHESEKEDWDMCERRFISHEETSTDVTVEIGKIAQMVCQAVQAYFGDIFSLAQIADNVTLSFSTSSSTHMTDDKIIMHQGTNYLLIKLQSKTGQNKIKTGVFKKGRFSKVYVAEICCLRPNNKAAEDKCKRLMNKKVNDVLDDVRNTF